LIWHQSNHPGRCRSAGANAHQAVWAGEGEARDFSWKWPRDCPRCPEAAPKAGFHSKRCTILRGSVPAHQAQAAGTGLASFKAGHLRKDRAQECYSTNRIKVKRKSLWLGN